MEKKGKIMNIQHLKIQIVFLNMDSFIFYFSNYIENLWNALKVILLYEWYIVVISTAFQKIVFLSYFDFILWSNMLQVPFLNLLCFYRSELRINSSCFNPLVF